MRMEAISRLLINFLTNMILKNGQKLPMPMLEIEFLLWLGKLKTQTQMSALRLEVAESIGLRRPNEFGALWVIDFPLLDWDEENERFHAIHHPFTAPKNEHINLLSTNPKKVLANAYDLVINGNEVGGGSTRIQ